MTTAPEIEKKPEAPPEGVKHRPEEVGVPERIQDIASPTPTKVTAQVTDDDDQDLILTPEAKEIAIELPDNQATFEERSKGSPSESITWFAAYWIRMAKKAIHFGWRVVGGGSKQAQAQDDGGQGQTQDDQGKSGKTIQDDKGDQDLGDKSQISNNKTQTNSKS